MRQRDALGISRRSRRVLQERDVFAARVMREDSPRAAIRSRRLPALRASALASRSAFKTSRSVGTRGCSKSRKPFRLAERDQESRFRVAQDVRLPRRVFRDAVRAKWRINRHGNSARQQDSRERVEKFRARRQHDRDRLAGLEARAACNSRATVEARL